MRLDGLTAESWWWRVHAAPATQLPSGNGSAPATRRLTDEAEIIEFTSYLANRR